MKRTWLLGMAAVALALLVEGRTGARAAAPPVGGQLNRGPSPNGATGPAYLTGVAALASNDVWAVGAYGGGVPQTLVAHWDGTAWVLVASPNAGFTSNFLNGVAALTSDDVWAVGYYGSDLSRTLVEHWDGVAWSVVASPDPGGDYNALTGVAALASNDVWAVGFYGGGVLHPLVEHWDGTAWLLVASPNVGFTSNYLTGVAALASNDVWAVGNYGSDLSRTLVEHWDGAAWAVLPSPNLGGGDNYLMGVAALANNDAWAVGTYFNGSGTAQTLVAHWDGTAWVLGASPNTGPASNLLNGVAALTSNDVWAVGHFYNYANVDQTLVEHWDGTAWAVLPSVNVGGSLPNQLQGVAALASGDVWAVDAYISGGADQTLVEHWDGTAWVLDASPF